MYGEIGEGHLYAPHDMLLCLRTTFDIPDELLRQAKRRAADEGAPLKRIAEEALRQFLRGPASRSRYKLRWRTQSGRILPGVRLEDREALFDLMDGRS